MINSKNKGKVGTYKCQICNRDFALIRGLGQHIRTHTTAKDYFDRYLKKQNEGICPICGKETRFFTLKTGYQKYCSLKCAMSSEDTKTKSKQTMKERYGVEHALQNNDFLNKYKQTCMDKWGVDNSRKAKVIKDKILETKKKNRPDDPTNREKAQNTNFERYGTVHPSQTGEIKEKIKKTNIEKYGVECQWQRPDIVDLNHSPEIIEKQKNTKLKNNTFNSSKMENFCYEVLCKIYGEYNIKRQYSSVDYPFSCDFYIMSLDTYIECNFYWTHGEHPFNKEDIEDMRTLEEWKNKSDKSNFYKDAIKTWTFYDILKRNTAIKNNLKFFEVFSLDEFYKLPCIKGGDDIGN